MGRLLEKAVIALVFVGTVFVSCVSCVATLPKPPVVGEDLVEVPPPPPAKKLWPSVARLSVESKKRGVGMIATGWAIDDSHIMTAGHFCEGVVNAIRLDHIKPGVIVTGSNATGGDIEVGRAVIVAWHNENENDMCLLFQKDHGLIPLPVLGDLSLVETEDPVTISGAPRGAFPIRTDGRVWFLTPDMLYLSMQVAPGNSGSAVVWNGSVIGMVITTIRPADDVWLGGAVRSDKLLEFYSENRLKKKKAKSK